MSIAFAVLAILLALLAGMAGGSKLTGQRRMRERAEHLGVPWSTYQRVGALQIAAVVGVLVGLLWRSIGVAAAAGMLFLMLGALYYDRRAHDRPAEMGGAVVALPLSAGSLVTAVATG